MRFGNIPKFLLTNMKKEDLEKLKLLANSTQEFIDAALTKLHKSGIDKGHEMTRFIQSSVGIPLWKDYRSYCIRCGFEMHATYFCKQHDMYFTNIIPKCNHI